MYARLDVVFEPVPRAHDMKIRIVEREAAAFAARLDHFIDARNDFSLADRAALMRTLIEVGGQSSGSAENADRGFADIHHKPPPFRHFVPGAHENFLPCGWHIPPMAAVAARQPRARPNPHTYARNGVLGPKSRVLYVENNRLSTRVNIHSHSPKRGRLPLRLIPRLCGGCSRWFTAENARRLFLPKSYA